MSGLVVAVPAFIFFYILRARAQSAILHAESQVYRLLDDIPYDQLSNGVRIGDNFTTEQAAKSRQLQVRRFAESLAQRHHELSLVQRPDYSRDIALPELSYGARLGYLKFSDVFPWPSNAIKRQRKRRRVDQDGDPEFQVAPMVDVLLVLMLFFMMPLPRRRC